ncbi:hypothetical protein PG993_006257 [Apiospora rasikravindrae]|uniref:Uncharacterized protein n=1 Tax=Apiospora rasikravindrae TaxID=990691 RepID=A0ABR1T7B0_9PEZI
MNWIQDNAGISNADLDNVYRYEEKQTTVITWTKDDQHIPDQPNSEPEVFIILARAGEESPSGNTGEKPKSAPDTGGQRKLRTVPFSRNTFRQITDRFYTHGSISSVISRADVPIFSNTQLNMRDPSRLTHPAYVYNCRSSNEWPKDLAVTVTHLPHLHKTFCIMFGCDVSTIATVANRLFSIGNEISYPLIMPAMMFEIERLRHINIMTMTIASLETEIAELDDMNGEMDEEETRLRTARNRNAARRTACLDAPYLRNCLTNWNHQLVKFRQCATTFDQTDTTSHANIYQPECRLRGTGDKVAARLLAIEEEYDQMIQECSMRLEGISLATQWCQGERNMSIARATSRDSKHMRIIGIITMIFLPGTFLAGVFSMSFFNWPTSDSTVVSHYVWVYISSAVIFTL